MAHASWIVSSNTPCVDGYVTINADSRSLCASAFARRSLTSILPAAVLATTTTRMPAMTPLAGVVPCADAGMSTTSRAVSPRSRGYARITIRPANSPCAPEFGCNDTAADPLISHSMASCSRIGAGHERADNREDVAFVDRFVERDRDGVVGAVPKVDSRGDRRFHGLADELDAAGDLEARRVEVLRVHLRDAELAELAHQQLGEPVDAARDLRPPIRTVIHRVATRDGREQRLRGADVRRRLRAAD